MAKQKINILSSTASGTTGSCWIQGTTASCIITDAITCQRNKGIFFKGQTCIDFVGACCLKDKENQTAIPCQDMTYSDCFDLAEAFNFSYIWNKDSCKNVSCDNSIKTIGACCNGNGMCTETTIEECNKLHHFFQGNGTICENDICIGGTGGCCDGTTCNDGITGVDCVSDKNLYLGKSKRCFEFTTTTENIPCLDSIVGYKINVGDVFEEGIVVGIYKPNESLCFGSPIFGGGYGFSQLTSDEIISSKEYIPQYDYNGYGVIHDTLCDTTSDSYIMIMSLHPSSEGTTGDQSYTWSHGGFYYGPLINNMGQVTEPQSEKLKMLKEGYIINTTFGVDINRKIIEENSTPNCSRRNRKDTPIDRIYNRTTHNFNGRWSADWGLHNTIRMTNAQLYYEEGITLNGSMYPSLYSPDGSFDTNTIPSTKPIRDMNEASSPVLDLTTSWYIPSINELAFIAQQCIRGKLNENLQNVGGTPMFGDYWSSTGTFNYTGNTGEGYSNGITADIGSAAWSMNFDDYGVKKDIRSVKKKIRPIRFIRCDGKTLKNTKYSPIWEVNY